MLHKSTLYNHLVYFLEYDAKHLRWIFHKLSLSQKQEKVEKLKELLKLLKSVSHQSLELIISLDESWFYLSADYEIIWLPHRTECPEKEKMISSKK
jgi:predicted membrane protein